MYELKVFSMDFKIPSAPASSIDKLHPFNVLSITVLYPTFLFSGNTVKLRNTGILPTSSILSF
jgi:hypothetical protein